MRLATFNLLHGMAPGDGAVSTERLVSACVSLDADVLCLQEVDRHQGRSGGVDQTAAIAEGMGAAAWRFVPALVGEPGGVWRPATDDDLVAKPDAPEPGYGVAVVSRLPVRAWHVVRLAGAKFRSPVFVPGTGGGVILLDDEPRVGLAAEVQVPGGSILVAAAHLSFVPGWNLAQLRRLTRALAALSDDCVLLGDLNVPHPFAWMPGGWRALVKAKTFPAANPSMQLDHALGRGALPRVTGGEARVMPLSDHRALTVDLDLDVVR